MPKPPSPEQAMPAAATDALDAMEQAGDHAQALADELAGGFDDLAAVRASAPEGEDSGRDLDALLAAAADTAMDGGYELTHASAAKEPPPAPALREEPAVPQAEAVSPVAAEQAVAPAEHDELAGAMFLEPTALTDEPPVDEPAAPAASAEPEPEPDASAPEADGAADDAAAFAAALADSVIAEAPAVEAAPAEAPADSAVEADPPQVDRERIQDAISAMEALLAEEQASEGTADATAAPPAAETSPSPEPEPDAAAGADGDAVDEDELAGLFAAPEIATAPPEAASTESAPVVRALSDENDDGLTAVPAPPIHPEADLAAAGGDVADVAEGSAEPGTGVTRGGLFPFGWLKMILGLLNRPLNRLSDEWRLAVSGVALAVAVPGALLLGYALFLK